MTDAKAKHRWRDYRPAFAIGEAARERTKRGSHSVDAIASKHQTLKVARDLLAEIVRERTKRNPEFPRLVAEAEARRRLARKLAAIRAKKKLSQTVVAARMGTAASVVSKLESGGDVKLSTLQRYCAAIGEKLPLAV